MPLVAELEVSFGSNGFDLSASVTGMGTTASGATVAPVAFDSDGLDGIVSTLQSIDLTSIEGIAASAASAVGAALDLVPSAQLLEPLRAALDIVAMLEDSTFSDFQTAIDAVGTGAPGLESLLPAIAVGVELTGDPAIARLGTVLERVAPGFDLTGIGTAVGETGNGLGAVVRLIGGLMAVESVTRDLANGVEVTASFLDSATITADLGTLRAWASSNVLVDLVVGIDPDDPELVDLIAGSILDYTVTLRRVGEAVVRGMAWGDATLAGLDVDAIVHRLDAATALLQESELGGVRRLIADLRARLDVLLQIDLPVPVVLEDFIGGLGTQVSELATAIDGIDPTGLTDPIGTILDTIVEPITVIGEVAQEVQAAGAAALGAVRSALAVVDLRPVVDAFGTILAPLTEALDALDAIVSGAQAAVEAAADAVDLVLDPVRDALTTASEAIRLAFAAVKDAVDALGLDDIVDALRTGVGTVADALAAAQLAPVFDTVAGALDITADALALTPRDLLPDDVRQALDDACAQLQAVDLGSVRGTLHQELDAINDSIDVAVLDALRDAQAAIVGFLDTIDPRPPLEAFEAGEFADLVARLREVDPSAPLAPVIEAIESVQSAIADFDPSSVFAPVEDALDEVETAIGSFDPEALLGPVEEQLAAFRDLVTDTLDLDGWDDRIDAVGDAALGWLGRLDLHGIVAALDEAHAGIVRAATEPPVTPGPIGTFVTALLSGSGVGVRADAVGEITGWLTGAVAPGAVVADRLAGSLDVVDRLVAQVEAVDVRGTVGPLAAHHARLQAALSVHAESSLLRVRLDASLAANVPGDVFGSVLVNRDGYLARLQAVAGALRPLVAASRSELDAIATGLRNAAAPLLEVTGRVQALLHAVTGVTVEGRPMREALAELLGRIQPSVLLAPIATALEGLRDRTVAALDAALLQPLRDAVAALRAAIDALDIGFVKTELVAARDDVVAVVVGLRPTTLLGPVLTEATELKDRLAGFDVLAPVRAVVEGLRSTIDTFERDLAPTFLAADGLDAYDNVRGVVAALEVGELLAPVFIALDGITAQLDTGMDRVIDALERTQDACASGGPSIGDALGAAAGLVGSAVGGDLSVSGSIGF